MRWNKIIKHQSLFLLCDLTCCRPKLWTKNTNVRGKKKRINTSKKNKKNKKRNSSTGFLLLLWLPLHRWPKCFLLGCSRVLGFGLQGAYGLFRFGLQGFEAQDLTVLVALVQSFELVNEGGGAVSLEAFVSGIKRGIFNQPGCGNLQPSSASLMYLLTLFYWWLFPHQWASSPRLKNQRIGILVPKIKNTFKNIY